MRASPAIPSAELIRVQVLDRPAHTAAVRVAAVIGFALLTGLSALVRLPLPDTPVPITLQTFVVVLAGLTLGARLGLLSMGLYLLLGIAGAGVFAGGRWGFESLLQPTGGYLVGFAVAQPVIGWLSSDRGGAALLRRGGLGWASTWLAVLMATVMGNVVIFACGLSALHVWRGVGLDAASVARTLEMGLWPFLGGAVIKGAASLIGGALLRPVRRTWLEPVR